ncbi:phospholipase D-like domain-containing protein [uncultured Pseudokineococcus sp.]|uniref:phospholipase D-like domain-containing protein n=1 Tax=uncultured Pseudokineococcus sp. TaxID=1642928 RepID=UPI00262E158E|nr:phospholipase D-like domain-containing protein [uncultured Pseudokineococcus sp.]
MIADLFQLPAQVGSVLLVVDMAIRVLALVSVPRGRLPSAGLAWLLAIFFLPILGGLAYLVIGRPDLPRERQRDQALASERFAERAPEVPDLVEHDPEPTWLGGLTRLMGALGAAPLLRGGRVEVVLGIEDQVRHLVEVVDGARETLHVEYYTLALDGTTRPVLDAVVRAHRRGVQVRVLADHLGCLPYPGWKRARRVLDEAGVEWRYSLPVQPLRGRYQRPDLRNHRKIVVVDHEVALVGSLNLIDPSYEKRSNRRKGLRWQDVLVHLEGPAVAAVEAVFAADWRSEAGEPPPLAEHPPAPRGDDLVQVVPSGPGLDRQSALRMTTALVSGAQRRVAITTPYFVPDESLLHAVTSAALSGVEVELYTGEIADKAVTTRAQRSYYDALLEAGVRIWLYPAPTVLHAKHITVDDDVVMLGSANMDIRSFELDLEISLVVRGTGPTAAVRASEAGRREVSHLLSAQEWSERPRRQRVLEDLARLTSALQ